MEIRSVVDRIENEWEHGHREQREGDGPWVSIPNSGWMKNTRRFWFQKTPVEIMREDMGFDTTVERANEFEGASDNDPAVWYYLAAATPPNSGDEALKWIMAALAAEINIRGLRFTDIAKVMPAHNLWNFVNAIKHGKIDRTFTKAIFAELLKFPRLDSLDATEAFVALIEDPRFKAISADDLEPIIDKVIADNAEQFEKAKVNPKLVQFFVGQVMRATQGKAPPPKITEIIQRKLAG